MSQRKRAVVEGAILPRLLATDIFKRSDHKRFNREIQPEKKKRTSVVISPDSRADSGLTGSQLGDHLTSIAWQVKVESFSWLIISIWICYSFYHETKV